MSDEYFRDFTRKTLERMRPEQAQRAKNKPLCLWGGYVELDKSCCCPFGEGLGIDPTKIVDDERDRIDFAMYSAATEAGFLDVTDEQKNPIFVSGLSLLSEHEVRKALEVAAARQE